MSTQVTLTEGRIKGIIKLIDAEMQVNIDAGTESYNTFWENIKDALGEKPSVNEARSAVQFNLQTLIEGDLAGDEQDTAKAMGLVDQYAEAAMAGAPSTTNAGLIRAVIDPILERMYVYRDQDKEAGLNEYQTALERLVKAIDQYIETSGKPKSGSVTDKFYLGEVPPVVNGVKTYMDGNKWCAVYEPTFTNIQESPVGFGDTENEALLDLITDQARQLEKIGEGDV